MQLERLEHSEQPVPMGSEPLEPQSRLVPRSVPGQLVLLPESMEQKALGHLEHRGSLRQA